MKRWVLASVFALAGCGAAPPAPRAPLPRPQAPAPAASAAPPRARYVPSPLAFSVAVGDARGFLGWGARALLDSKGQVRFAGPERENAGLRAISVPPHLGGGWLFLGEHVCYAEEFLAPLRVTPVLSSGRDDIELGFDFVRVGTDAAEYLSAPAFEPIPAPATLPPDTEHLAALDARQGLALLGDRTLRFSNDAGKTWSATELGDAPVDILRRGPDALYFYASSRLLRFEPGGGVRLVPPDAPEPRHRWQDSPLDSAVREGFLLNATQVLLPSSAPRIVELDTGRARPFHVESNRYGGACEAIAGVDGGVLNCGGQILSNAIGRPLREREAEANALLARSSRGALLFRGPCAEIHAFAEDRALEAGQPSVCVRHVGGRWDSYALPAAWSDGSQWPLALRPDDSVVGLALDAKGLTFFDIPSGRAVPLQMPPDVDWGAPRELSVLADDRLCVWQDAARSTLIDDRGQLDWREPVFEVVRWGHAGPRAFALGTDGKAFETQSCGASWTEVAAPPGPWAGTNVEPCGVPDKLANPSLFSTSQCGFVCSEVGCAVEPFLRIGWELAR